MARNTLAPIPFGILNLDPFDGFDRMMSPRISPLKCDVKETEEGFEVTADFPGAAKEDIGLSIDGGILTLSYDKTQEKEEGDEEKYLVKERSSVSVKRSFNLGDVDEESATATLDGGVLTVKINKREPVETKKTIEIG